MRCRILKNLDCYETYNCFRCPIFVRNQTTLDNVEKIQYHLYICPYCLFQDNYEGFFTRNKKGKILKLRGCINCNNKFFTYTLDFIRDWLNNGDIEKYAEWVYNYPSRDFFKKISFNKFNDGLKKLNIIQDFWDCWKKIKGKVIVKNVM